VGVGEGEGKGGGFQGLDEDSDLQRAEAAAVVDRSADECEEALVEAGRRSPGCADAGQQGREGAVQLGACALLQGPAGHGRG